MIRFAYLCILLFIIIFTFILINKSIKMCPSKIKVFYMFSFILVVLKVSTLFVMYFTNRQSIAYLLKSFVWISYLYIPLLSLACIYIFFRSENKKFNYNYSFLVILTIIYLIVSKVYKFSINIDNTFGFVIYFKEIIIPALINLITIASLSVVSLINMDKPFANNRGLKLITFSLLVSVFEYISFLGGIKIFPYPLIGELLILYCCYMAIDTFKKLVK